MSLASHNKKRYSATFTLILFGTLAWLAWSVVAFAFIGDISYEIKEPGLHTQKRDTLQTPLHFAMVHDVIHQRFKKHGPAWHQARIKEGMYIVQMYRDEPEMNVALQHLLIFDDVAVAHERLGNPDAGLAILAEKKALLLKTGPEPKYDDKFGKNIVYTFFEKNNAYPRYTPNEHRMAWYRYYANTGTLLVHKHMSAAMKGDETALAGIQKAEEFIRKSILINPLAHFGREIFQLMAIENLQFFMRSPANLRQFSLFGYHIEKATGHISSSGSIPMMGGYAGYDPRDYIRRVSVLYPKINDTLQLPFDELTVGIMGMWIYGGGANPHFAMNFGIIMEHVGQRRIAWTAYRRAISMKDRFWPDKHICNYLASFCDRRMLLIEEDIGGDIRDKLESAYLQDLQKGLDYQAAQAAYEASRIENGVSIRDEDFFDQFNKEFGSIASPSGKADLVTTYKTYRYKDLMMDFQVLFILLGALLGYYLYFKTSLLDKHTD